MGKKYRLYGRKASRTGGLRKRYKEHDNGPGGVKCPCCGADDSKTVRRREKQRLEKELKEED